MARGNIDSNQIQTAARLGTGTKIQMTTETAPVAGHVVVYGSSGDTVDSGVAPSGFGPVTASATAHKFLASYDAGSFTFALAQPAESDLSFTDITTNNVSTSAHGFAPKAPNDATKFLNGTGGYSIPAGTGAASPLTTKGDIYTYGTAGARLAVGTDGQLVVADSSQSTGLNWATQPYDLVCSLPGLPGGGATVLLFTFTRAVGFAGNFSASKGTVGTNPTATATYTVKKNGSSIGTVVVSTLGVVTFTTTSGAAQSFAIGDRMTIIAPGSQDATLADVAVTLAGTR